MQVSDFVKLINDTEELSAKNIFKGCGGVLVSYIAATDEWIVQFLDPYNYGAFAVAKAKTKDLKYSSDMHPDWIKDFLDEIKGPDFYTHTKLKPPKFKEHDEVILINEKPQYVEAGIKKGDKGVVMFGYAIRSKWDVIFSDEETGFDIAELEVHEDDIKVYKDIY
ncbi:MAG: hypothetical protein J1F33_05710 [Clostridiales bacterium]|nr:hypothetical protein [Clostridiales bacterium]